MNSLNKSLLILMLVGLTGMWSCQKWDEMDPPSGNQKVEPVPVDPAYAGCADPTMGKEDGTYYIISSNAEISGITHTRGLLLRTTPNLVDMAVAEDNAYLLSDVVDNWAGARLLELDGTIDVNNAVMGQPCLREVDGEWRLYYSVQAGTKASVIGYAVAPTLAGGLWEDKGEILSSDPTSTFKAMSPSFCESLDGTKHYMAFGNSGDGVYVTELNPSTSMPTGQPVLVASRADATVAGNPTMFYAGGYYHIIFTFDGALPLTCQIASTDPLGTYTDFAGRSVINIANFWEITRILTNYQHQGGQAWEGVNGADVVKDGVNYFLLHHAKSAGSDDPTLHIRKMDLLLDSRRVHSPTMPVPVLSPTRYYQENINDITMDDIVGDWYYGTIWGHVSSGINDPMTFSADGSYDGGSWDFNPGSHILHLTSTEWGGEEIYLYVSKGNDWDTDDKALTIVASGVNDTFTDYPGAWMKKQGTATGGGDEIRTGVYDPSLGKETKFWVFSSNAAVDGYDYEKGIVVKSSEDLIFFDEEGYVLGNVIDNWAGARLKELDAEVLDENIVMGQPCVRQVGSEWRLYYSVQAGTQASVIGYATTASLENQQWVDQGEILYSDASSAYIAMSPSFCKTTDGEYLTFGEGTEGVFIVEINQTTGETTGTPVQAATCVDVNIRVGASELVYYNGYYTLIATYNNVSVLEGTSTNPMGPYVDFGGRNLSDKTGFGDNRILTPYNFTGGTSWANTDGIGICQDGTDWYVVHQARNVTGEEYQLHVRAMNWLEDSRIATSTHPYPILCPVRYFGNEKDAFTSADLIGTWHYGTIWWIGDDLGSNNLSNPMMVFSNDGTYVHEGTTDGGTWDYDETTHILHLVSTAWGGENIFIYINVGYDWDNSKNTLVGSGVNDTFWIHPTVWMKKV